MSECRNAQMDGWVGWVEKWVDRWTDRWTKRWVNRWVDG